MKIVLDVMGGDLSPSAPVLGAIQALKKTRSETQIVLIGNQEVIDKSLDGFTSPNLSIKHTDQSIEATDKASTVVKSKPNSSLVIGLKMLKEKKADAFISAGNTGAQMAASTLILGRIPHVKRPALSVFFPALTGGKILCDVGANPDASASHLLQFAIMSSVYLDHVEGVKNPKIGLINIGEEPSKGSELYQKSHTLLKEEMPNFIGNVESRNIMTTDADVLVCDGFVGNTIIKFAEGWILSFADMIKIKIMSRARYKIGAQMIQPALQEIRNQFDYEEHGGTPLLGVNGISIVCHGSSTSKAIMNSIILAQKSIKEKIIEDISRDIDKHLEPLNES
ncbi:MAG: phosphate--acyl-ACP acyltransferase [Candidatus Marinimicrobia bacterium]|nr:phosphate--acyl-ACP acyltransferase [Candidatus Neomarinimicrobiota bacterium]|tara:strand:+ start:1280 stop:2290 length:1011 start_codon:yes stop_codon:yes gene_type:complete